MNKLLSEKAENGISIFIGILGVLLIFFWLSPFHVPPEETAITPPKESPVTETGTILLSEPLLKEPYKAPQNPFGESEFKKSPKIVLNGSFAHLQLDIEGTVVGGGKRFLILNFYGQGGIIKGERKSVNSLDVDKTNSKGGVFIADDPIRVSVDLLSDNLGTIGAEFQKTGIGSRSFSFITDELEPTVTNLLVVPFMENGLYGGATIDNLTIRYACKDDDSCLVKRCDAAKSSQCIQDNFGSSALKKWMKDNGY